MSTALIGALRAVLGMDSVAFTEGLSIAEKRLNQFGKRMDKLGGKLQTWGAGLSLAVTTPIVALGKGFIDAASDAAESASAFDFLFKDQAAGVRKWADETAKALGRSTYALQDQALAFQQYFSQVAPTNAQAADLSKTFTQLAQDLSSFYNVSEGDALEKLRSGLSGEAEPLRAFGVFLNEAAVKAKAMEMGLTGANDELTEQEKVLARAALILEQTTAAQGDAARTAGSFANQQKALASAINDLGIKLGTILLPYAQKLVTVLTEMVNWFSALSPATQEWILIAAGLAASLGPALIALGMLATSVSALIAVLPALGAAFVALTGPIGLAVAALAAIGAAWVYWDDIKAKFPGFAAVVETTVSVVKTLISGLWEHFQLQVQAIGSLLTGDWAASWEAAKQVVVNIGQTLLDVANTIFPGAVDAIVQKIRDMAATIMSVMRALPAEMLKIGQEIIAGLWNGISAKWEEVKGKVYELGNSISGSIKSALGIQSPSRVMHEVGVNTMQGLVNGMASMSEQVKGVAVATADAVASIQPNFGGAWEGLRAVGEQATETKVDLDGMFSSLGSSLAGLIKGTKDWRDVLSDVLGQLAQMALSGMGSMGGIGSFFRSLFGGLIGFANGGNFTVGGAGGIDSQVVAFRASPGEQVSVSKPGLGVRGGQMHITFAVDADSNGNLLPFVTSVSRGEAASAAGKVAKAVPSMVDARTDERQVRRIRPAVAF